MATATQQFTEMGGNRTTAGQEEDEGDRRDRTGNETGGEKVWRVRRIDLGYQPKDQGNSVLRRGGGAEGGAGVGGSIKGAAQQHSSGDKLRSDLRRRQRRYSKAKAKGKRENESKDTKSFSEIRVSHPPFSTSGLILRLVSHIVAYCRSISSNCPRTSAWESSHDGMVSSYILNNHDANHIGTCDQLHLEAGHPQSACEPLIGSSYPCPRGVGY